MKKNLSLILCVCLIVSALAFPVNAVKEEALLYKFDFSGTAPEYSKTVKDRGITGVNYAFSTINYGENGEGNAVVDYVDFGGKKAMRIRANGSKTNVAVTPLMENGAPIVLKPGEKYTVKADIVAVRYVGNNDYQRFLTEAYVRNDGKTSDTISPSNYSSVSNDKYFVPGAIQHRSAAVYTDGSKAYYMTCNPEVSSNRLASHAAFYTSNAVVVNSTSMQAVCNSLGLSAGNVYNDKGEKIDNVSYAVKNVGGTTKKIDQIIYTLPETEASDDTEKDFDDLADWGINKQSNGLYEYSIKETKVNYTNHLAISFPGTNANAYIKVEDGIEPINDTITLSGNEYCKVFNEYYVTNLEVYIEREKEEIFIPDEKDTDVYYKFDFSEECPVYTSSATETYSGLGRNYASINQKNATTVVDYVEYNGKYAMRIRTNGGSGNIVITPRKNDAENTPIKLKPGNNYRVNYNLVVSRYGTTGTARFLTEPYVIANGTIETSAPYPNPKLPESAWYKPGTSSTLYRSAAWYLGAPVSNEIPTVYYIQADPQNNGIVASYASLYVAPLVKQASGYSNFDLTLQKAYSSSGEEITSTVGYSSTVDSTNEIIVRQQINALPTGEDKAFDTKNDFDDLADWNVSKENDYYKYKKNGNADFHYTDHLGISVPAFANTTQYIKVEGDVEPLNESQVITIGGEKYCLAYNEYFITDLEVTGGDKITCEIDYNGGHPYVVPTTPSATKEFYEYSAFDMGKAYREGCKFLGWFKDEALTVKAEDTAVEEGNKYFAKWLMYGDIDGDEKVDTIDLANIKLYLAGAESGIGDGADCNDDEKVDTLDLAKMKLYLAGAEGKLGPVEDNWRNHPQDYKLVAFTFDDVPSYTTATNNNTRKIIDAFLPYDGKATLFVTGTGIRNRGDELVEYGLSQGFELGNHTSTHANLSTLNREETLKEITDLNDLVKERYGYDLKWLRTGGISSNQYLWDIMTELNMPAFRGGCPIYDYAAECKAEDVKQIALEYAKDGMVYLMHGFSSATANCIEEVLGTLYEDGYRFVTISEYFELRGITDITTERFITDLSDVG